MAGWTNRGKYWMLHSRFHGHAAPGHVYVALVTNAVAPGPDTNTLSQLTEIAAGNGYATGGYELHLDATDWPTVTEDDGGDKAYAVAKNVVWTASGGPIPASGAGARYAVLTDDNGTIGNREVFYFWDLGSVIVQGNGAALTLDGLQIEEDEP